MHESFFSWPVWVLWSIGTVFLSHRALVFLFRNRSGSYQPYVSAYLGLAGLFVVGLVVVGLSGMPMYGFDNTNWRHQFGYFVFFMSPLGLPLLVGTPFVFLSDLIRQPWKTKSR